MKIYDDFALEAGTQRRERERSDVGIIHSAVLKTKFDGCLLIINFSHSTRYVASNNNLKDFFFTILRKCERLLLLHIALADILHGFMPELIHLVHLSFIALLNL